MSAGFAASVAEKLLGCEVEIFQGNSHDVVKYSDIERSRKSVLHGVLVDVLTECLVLECGKGDQSNYVYINTWSVQAIIEVKNGISLFDIYYADERKLKK